MFKTIMMTFKLTWQNRLRISFCSKFTAVYLCQELFHCKSFWQSYCENKMVQFFCHTVYIRNL